MPLFDFLARAARGAVTRDPALRGMHLMNQDNYIRGFYGTNDPVTKGMLTLQHGAGAYLKGFTDSMMPSERALVKSRGMTTRNQDIVRQRHEDAQILRTGTEDEQAAVQAKYSDKGLIKNVSSKVMEAMGKKMPESKPMTANTLDSMATSNIEYPTFIMGQGSRRVPTQDMPSADLEKVKLLQGAKPFSVEYLKATFNSFKKNARGYGITDLEVDNFTNHVSNIHKDSKGVPVANAQNALFRVRHQHGNPGSSTTFQSFYQNNEFLNPIAKSFNQLAKNTRRKSFKDTEEMKQYFADKTIPVTDRRGNVTQEPMLNMLVNEDPTGLYFNHSFTSGEKTDGGVNFLMKVRRDGKGLYVVSDEHNHAEKYPIIGRFYEKFLDRAITTTPIIPFDIKKFRSKQVGEDMALGRMMEDVKLEVPPVKKEQFDAAIEKFINAVPDSEELKLQRAIAGIRGAGVAGAGALGYSLFGDKK